MKYKICAKEALYLTSKWFLHIVSENKFTDIIYDSILKLGVLSWIGLNSKWKFTLKCTQDVLKFESDTEINKNGLDHLNLHKIKIKFKPVIIYFQ